MYGLCMDKLNQTGYKKEVINFGEKCDKTFGEKRQNFKIG